MSLKPEDKIKAEEEELKDDPIPTYEEWLDETAKEISAHPFVVIFKSVVEFVRYLQTREQLLIQFLRQKGILLDHEVEEFFGEKAHKEASAEGLKQLTKKFTRAAAQGKLVTPEGKKLDPDTILSILNDVLDLNNTGWTGKSLELIAEMADQRNLRKDYEKEVSLIKLNNEMKRARRKQIAKNEELRKDRERRDREERERRVGIYISRCRIADKKPPTKEEQQKMLNGEIPIPND